MDRLRRLDALFAERVLGCKVSAEPTWLHGRFACECEEIRKHGWSEADGEYYGPQLPLYTRSLDAAWEGIALWQKDKIDAVTLHTAAGLWLCQLQGDIEMGPDEEDDDYGFCSASATNPAEALVLACLRAVGVSEDELK